MLRFELGNYNLDLPKDSSIDFEFNQPAFTDDFIKGSGSYDITFPKSPSNDKAFEFTHNLTAPLGVRLYNIKVHFGANTIINGTLSLWESDSDGYTVTIEKSEIPFLVNDLAIKELDWTQINMGDDNLDVIAYAKSASADVDDLYPVCFPHIWAPNWYGEGEDQREPAWFKMINYYNSGLGDYKINTIQEDYLTQNVHSLVPCVTYFAILKQIADQFGYTIVGSALDVPEIKNMSFLNNYSLDQLGEAYPVDYNGAGGAAEYEPNDPYGTVIGSGFTPTRKGTHLFTYDAEQTVEVTNVLFKLCTDSGAAHVVVASVGSHATEETFTLTFEHYFNNTTTEYFLVMFKTNDLDPTPTISGDLHIRNIGWNHLNIYATTIDIPNHLPAMSVSSFLNHYKKAAGLNIDFDKDNTQILFNLREDLLQGEIKTLEDVNPMSIRKIYNQSTGYIFKWDNDDELDIIASKYEGEFLTHYAFPDANDVNQYALSKRDQAYWKVEYDEDTNHYSWQWYKAKTPSYTIGDSNHVEISMGAKLADMNYGGGRIAPYISIEGVSPINPEAEATEDPVVFIYHGMLLDTNAPRPTGSSNSWSYDNLENLNSLQLEGSKGLFQWRLKHWFEKMLFTDEIEMEVYLKSPQVKELFEKRLYYKGILMLLIDMDISVNETSILPSNLTLRKLG